MGTRSNSSNLFSPLRDPESLIRQKNLGEPSSLFDFEEVMNNNHNQEPPPQNGPPPLVRPNGQAPQTMEELCQPVSDDALCLSFFPYSLTRHAIAWYDRLLMNSIHSFDDMMRKFLSKYFPLFMVTKLRNEITKFEQKPHESLFKAWERYKFSIDRCPNHNMHLVTQIDTFYNGLTLSHQDTINAATGGTFMQKTLEECYELIENMTAHYNHWDTSAIQDETFRNISSTSTTESPEVVRQLEMMNKNFLDMMSQIQTVKAVDTKSETCDGPHSFTECPAIGGYTQETAYATTGSLPKNTIPNPQADFKAITTRNSVTLAGPSVFPPPSKEVNREPETITDQVLTGSTNNVPPLVVQLFPASTSFSTISSSKTPEVTKDTPKPTIPYPLRANKQKLHEKDDILALIFLEIFRNLHFELSFVDALLHMPKFDLMFKTLLNNKEKLFDLSTTLMNENCSTVILKKFPEKLGDPSKFLISCDFPEFDECLAHADLGASINLMPLSIWKKLSSPELNSTQMILKLADRSTTRPAGIAEDVFVKVRKFHFPTDFVVIDYVVEPRVPLILKRPFLRTGRALINVYGEELSLRVDDEAITFNVGQTSKYSYNDVESINRIDVIDVAYEEYIQEVLGFSNNSKSGSPTPASDPIISSSSPSFTPFEGSDFILEEIKTFLQTPNELFNLDDDYYDTEGDILYFKKLLNEDPSPNLPPVKTKDLKQVDATMTKPSIEEPPELELKELLSHLEYAFLEGTDKLPVIISKELKDEEQSTLLKVLKSHKQAIMWKIFNIKGIDPHVCTHKILMEDDFKPAVQHQIRVNPKIHEVIKKEVIKLLDARLIYLISDSPWVNPVHCVSKKGMTVVENKDNELIMPGAKNLAADYLSTLENPHQDELEKKEITEAFPLETLGMISFRGDSSISWFVDFANYLAGNFIVKENLSQQKKKFFKDVKHYFRMTHICLRFARIK
nr:reverse transcriptase domain-containing protein [Tanacetum cinerariifolium]